MHPDLALMLSARIETPRLVLEPLEGRHAEVFFSSLQDDAIYQWISMEKPTGLEPLREHWRSIETRLSPDHQYAWATWAVRRRADGVYLGRVDAEITDELEVTNLGYYLFSPHWGHGYATEAVTAATQSLLTRGVRRLVATVTVGNKASARVLEKAGFAFARVLPGNDTIRGVKFDDDEYVRSATAPDC
jgi:RimJ/RimL family protein N-acetyltransferase